MIFPSLSFRSPLAALLCGLFLLAAALPAETTVSQSPSDYHGAWKVQHPEAGQLYILIWEEGRASYFFTANPRVEVFQGEWELGEQGLKVAWANEGFTHLAFSDGRMTAVFAAEDPFFVRSQRTVFEAQRVSQGEIGKWARPPDAPLSRAAEGLAGFFGNWSAERPDGSRFFIIVEEDRTAGSSFRHVRGTTPPIVLRGSWRRIGTDLHIIWNDASYTILRPRGRGHEIVWFEPGVSLEGEDRSIFPSIRVQVGLPQDWLQAYRGEQFLGVNVAVFRQRNTVSNFFRGFWDIALPDRQGDYIQIRRFSNAQTNRFGNQRGEFRPQPDSLVITWQNGVREIIQAVGVSFVLTTYRPGQPLDGQPDRIVPLLPRDESKLVEYRQRKTGLFQFE
jgi:hypothetical protein